MNLPMRESYIEKKVTEHAYRHGWLSIKLNGQHDRGKPDRVYLRDGEAVFVEFKAKGKKPTNLQKKYHERLNSFGFCVHVIDDFYEGCRIVEEGFCRA